MQSPTVSKAMQQQLAHPSSTPHLCNHSGRLYHSHPPYFTNSIAGRLRWRKPQHLQKLILPNNLDAAPLPYVPLCEDPFIGFFANDRILPIVTHNKIVSLLSYILLRDSSEATDQFKGFLPLVKQETPCYSDMFPFNRRLLRCIHDTIPVLRPLLDNHWH